MSVHPHTFKAKKNGPAHEQMLLPLKPIAHGSDQAPVIYFDGAVAYGLMGHVAQVELAVTVRVPVENSEIRTRTLVTCHLRASTEAMAQLADVIEKALMMGGTLPTAPPPEEGNA